MENTGNAEPTCTASKEDESAALTTPNTPQVIPPDGEGVEEFKEEKLEEQDAKPGGGH